VLASHQLIGEKGEQIAADFLIKNGYQLLKRNYSCRFGEMDIIATIAEYLVFCEVKTRQGEGKIHPTSAITKKKIKKLRQIGLYYIEKNKITRIQPRFDVISIQLKSKQPPVIEHFINAI